jgi:hypothetical protein
MHGAQKVPSPLHTPARGVHTPTFGQVWPDAQSALLPHSGVQRPPSQCWYVPFAGGQSSSLAHVLPAAGEQSEFHPRLQRASTSQSASVAHCFSQKSAPVLSGTQCCCVPPDAIVLEQSRSVLHGAQWPRGKHTRRVAPIVDNCSRAAVVTFGTTFSVAHHHVAGHSPSAPHPNTVQKAFASVGLVP